MLDPTQDAISFSHSGFKWDKPQRTPLTNKPRHVEQTLVFEETPTFWPLKAHISGNCNPIPDCTQIPIPYFLVVDRLTRKVVYTLMQIANAFLSKTQSTKKALKPLRAHPGRGSGPIWKSIEANVLHNLL